MEALGAPKRDHRDKPGDGNLLDYIPKLRFGDVAMLDSGVSRDGHTGAMVRDPLTMRNTAGIDGKN
jgi:hypothetical protein